MSGSRDIIGLFIRRSHRDDDKKKSDEQTETETQKPDRRPALTEREQLDIPLWKDRTRGRE